MFPNGYRLSTLISYLIKQLEIRPRVIVHGHGVIGFAELDLQQTRYLLRVARLTLRKQIRKPLHLAIVQCWHLSFLGFFSVRWPCRPHFLPTR